MSAVKRWRSPAKINVFLKVERRRLDGFHDLSSLFQAVDLFDTLEISLSEKECYSCNTDLPMDRGNLVCRAVELFRQETHKFFPISLHLDKKIPLKAGLGGGSSNAATTLWAMNELSGHPLTNDKLMELGAQLGSDVPFFFSMGTALCEGRGERVSLLPPLPHLSQVTIVSPKVGMSTPEVFSALDLAELTNRDVSLELERHYRGDPEYFNDLEVPAFRLNAELARLKQSLSSPAWMSGSGSSICHLGSGEKSWPDCNSYIVRPVYRKTDSWYA